MESFVEVSLIHAIITLFLSVYIGQIVALQPLSKKRIWFYACISATLGCMLWLSYSWMILILVEVIAFFFFFRYAYKTYFCALVLRFLCFATTFVFYGGSFHNFYWFVPMDCPIWVMWLLYALIILLLQCKWKDIVSRLAYVYELTIFTNDETLKLTSYLDSGNLLTYQHVPILFIDKKYHAYFKNQRIELVVMNSVSASEVIRCYECDIQLLGCKKQHVYINADRHLKLPFTCSVLLNMNVMTTG